MATELAILILILVSPSRIKDKTRVTKKKF